MMWEQAWLTYKPLAVTGSRDTFSHIYAPDTSRVIASAVKELHLAFEAMFDLSPRTIAGLPDGGCSGGIYLRINPMNSFGQEGFKIHSQGALVTIEAISDRGLLYGVFALLREIRMGHPIDRIAIEDEPDNPLRMLNHWDNMDGSIERGYSGDSFFFHKGDIIVNDRIRDYARLNASIGINGVVINNVNVAGDAIELITDRYLEALKAYTDIFGAYGIKLYLSLDYAAPMDIGGMSSCDPLDPAVIQWWENALEKVYKALPELGGFLIKADSEGRPGPFTYDRTHADGANMLARIVGPQEGIILWRCFVYNCRQDWRDTSVDRARAGFDHFMPLDGSFDDNVILQIKNGPMDFQVREPVSPLFGAMKATNQVLEFQIAQEYTGQQRHVCYLVPMWKEILEFHTHCGEDRDRVADVVAGKIYPMKISGIAAVANTGNDSNWTGHDLAGANYYGYGRLIWKTDLSSETIAEEWIGQMFGLSSTVLANIKKILMMSWPAYESYTSPLGIGWMVNPNHHYGPNVDGYEYDRWGTYHRADHLAIGVDRTGSGTGYTGQYFPENERLYAGLDTCPEDLLLFFHRVPYNHVLSTDKTLIQHIYDSHFDGVEAVADMMGLWQALSGEIGEKIHQRTLDRFNHQYDHAKLWRDVVNSYFYRKTMMDDEKGRKLY